MRILLALLAALAAPVPTAATAAHALPTTYVVSRTPADNPEGIEVTGDGTIYVTSLGTGAVYRGRDRDPELRPFIPAGADGRHAAAGVHLDRRGRIFVAGFDTGVLYVYDWSGRLLAERPTIDGAKLNDFVFTEDAVYVTDSATGILWRAWLSGSWVGPLQEWLPASAFDPAPAFMNGIVTTAGQRTLIVSDLGSNTTFHVDIATRSVRRLSIVGAPDGTFSADGLLLEGHRLYGVFTHDDPASPGHAVLGARLMLMSADFRTATWVADSPPAAEALTPTTIARDHRRLLWVESQLLVKPGTPPYTVTVVPGLH
jgi:hypothetical protein